MSMKNITEMTIEQLQRYTLRLPPLCDARIEAAREIAHRRGARK